MRQFTSKYSNNTSPQTNDFDITTLCKGQKSKVRSNSAVDSKIVLNSFHSEGNTQVKGWESCKSYLRGE